MLEQKKPGGAEGPPGEWNGADITGVRRGCDRDRNEPTRPGHGSNRVQDRWGSRNLARIAERRRPPHDTPAVCKPPAAGNTLPVAGK